ncbi:MAG: hypothetical protein FJ138_07790, partial [Deltaproteobacteria bacterium]|nr:hypothetical protein [Deltaproteobacteria bacterium]
MEPSAPPPQTNRPAADVADSASAAPPLDPGAPESHALHFRALESHAPNADALAAHPTQPEHPRGNERYLA